MTPAARLEIDGRDVSTALEGDGGILIEISITDEAGLKSDTLEIELDDREGFKAPDKGKEIKVWLGYEPEPVYMGLYKVDEWTKSGPVRTLKISAKAAELTTEIKAAKTRSWHEMTIGAIVTQIAREHGLTPAVHASFAQVEVDHIDQQQESDAAFLTRLAKRTGAMFKLADGKCIFTEKGSRELPSGEAKPTLTLTPYDVSDWSVTSSGRGDYKSVRCFYRQRASGKRVSVIAGAGKPQHTDRKLYASEAEARQSAKAQLADLKSGKLTAEIEGVGNPALFAELVVTLTQFDPEVDRDYTAKSVRHTLNDQGYVTTATLEVGRDDSDQTSPEA